MQHMSPGDSGTTLMACACCESTLTVLIACLWCQATVFVQDG